MFLLIQVERTWDLVRDSGQRKLTYSSQNHCTLHFVSVGAKPLSPRQCAPSRSVYLSRRLNSHWERFVITHHLQKWESQLRLRWTQKRIHQNRHIRLINNTKNTASAVSLRWHYPNQVTGPDHLVCSQPAVGKLPIYSLVRFHRTIPAKHTVNYYLMFHLRHSH